MHYKKIAATGTLALSLIILGFSVVLSSIDYYYVPLSTVKYHQLSVDNKKQIDCLAENIYREAAYEPKEGWAAVAFVTLNRVRSGNYASTVCGVVYQKTGDIYQFSWVGMQNRLHKINNMVYNDILDVATTMYMNHSKLKDVTEGATYYHADYVNPGWKLEKTKKIGQHIFYKSSRDKI